MKDRDKAILKNLEQFRCMSRDDIAEIHFSNIKNSTKCCNAVLKRLRRDGYIEANTSVQPYVYYPAPCQIKKDSQKTQHFLSIVDVYKQMIQHEQPKQLIVEPKYGKGYAEPDIFTIWRCTPLFIEVQRSVYSQRVMNDKIKRYETYYKSGEWQREAWQPTQRKYFPLLLILTQTRYSVSSNYFSIYQAENINEFLLQMEGQRKPKQEQKQTIRIQVPS